MANVLIRLPETARRGEIISVSAMIGHPMETGFRAGNDGRTVARDILRRFSCRYLGQTVFAADMHPATSANPYWGFSLRASSSGSVEFLWEGDHGFKQLEMRTLRVSE
jgi:sulfur-oxidizing protein SoxZ